MEDQTKTNNRLWQARRRAGLEQKQVARLLGHKTCDQISRYERGDRLPSLEIALKLEIILRVPVRELFPDLYEHCRAQISKRALPTKPAAPPDDKSSDPQMGAHLCTYETLVLQRNPSENAISLAKQHSIKLVRKLSDAINAQKSRS
jgi:transcriptional regulator with XRE-family HTH domain